MSCKVNCWDIAVMESLCARAKVELIYAKNYQSIEKARSGIFGYIEVSYKQSGDVSFVDFEKNEAISA